MHELAIKHVKDYENHILFVILGCMFYSLCMYLDTSLCMYLDTTAPALKFVHDSCY